MACHGAPAPADRPVQILAAADDAVIMPWTLWVLRRGRQCFGRNGGDALL
jgi:hypothetical protein